MSNIRPVRKKLILASSHREYYSNQIYRRPVMEYLFARQDVRALPNEPNRRVRHKDNWEVNLNFSPTLLEELADPDPEVREEAQRSVCTRFRKACERKYRDRWIGAWVNWSDLTITVNAQTSTDVPSKSHEEEDMESNPDCKCDKPVRCPVHDA